MHHETKHQFSDVPFHQQRLDDIVEHNTYLQISLTIYEAQVTCRLVRGSRRGMARKLFVLRLYGYKGPRLVGGGRGDDRAHGVGSGLHRRPGSFCIVTEEAILVQSSSN